MRNGRCFLRAFAVLVLAAFALTVSTCGGQGRTLSSLQSASGAQPREIALVDALTQLDALPVPDGVKPEVFKQLKDALEKALQCRARTCIAPTGDNGDAENGGVQVPALHRIVSTPPTGNANRVNDLAIVDNGDGSYSLTWHYRNVGDYNQDGVVGIADITPLAQHFGQVWAAGEENSISAVVDGSENKTVDIADVTPIAVNLGTEVAGYDVQVSESEEGEYTYVQTVARVTGVDAETQRMHFALSLTPVQGYWYRVTPLDRESAAGEVSNAVQALIIALPLLPPGDLQASDGTFSDRIILQWAHPVEGQVPDGYKVFRADSQNGPYALQADIGYVLQWEDTTVPDENIYWYQVTSYKSGYADSGFTLPESGYTENTTAEWHVTTLGHVGGAGTPVSLTEVNGCPAMSFWDSNELKLKFIRAVDSKGVNWAPAVALDDCGSVLSFVSLAVINGNPAVSYASAGDLMFVRAGDIDGAAWNQPVGIDIVGEEREFSALAEIDSKPAVAFINSVSDELMYAYANDADGTDWNEPVFMAYIGDDNWPVDLKAVNGLPAIAYYDAVHQEMRYVHALNTFGTAWCTPVTIDSGERTGIWLSLAIVNGNPAISYHGDTSDELRYARAWDVNGSSWNAPIVVEALGNTGLCTSLKVCNGYPVICHINLTDGTRRYVRAGDEKGDTWCAPTIVDNEEFSYNESLAIINGVPVIGYSRAMTLGELRFAALY